MPRPTPEECGFTFSPWTRHPSYTEIAAKLGTVLLNATAGDYQGDELFLFADGDRRGLLIQAYGSCSGCDQLAAVDTPEDARALIDDMVTGTHWEDSPGALARWIEARNWEDQWTWREGGVREFLSDALCLLYGIGRGDVGVMRMLGLDKFIITEEEK